METIEVRTKERTEFVPITHLVSEVVRGSGVMQGICVLSTGHTTAGLTVNENSDPDVIHDLIYLLERVAPWDDPHYRHYEGNSAAHLKSSLMGTSLTLIVDQGSLVLGRWQGIFLCEFDGPRTRKVHMQVIPTDNGKKGDGE
ncbi:MAG TPA: YjbQ family protein [Firmicutes bacterium]|jgi:secondary thiamine-phosphate synthase enzyme|nr:MAG: hypothetical protein AA931_04640 [Peptococcaceae bacterium 1109]HHT73067.1 YjbQ family protein [Bacillota bacterium]